MSFGRLGGFGGGTFGSDDGHIHSLGLLMILVLVLVLIFALAFALLVVVAVAVAVTVVALVLVVLILVLVLVLIGQCLTGFDVPPLRSSEMAILSVSGVTG